MDVLLKYLVQILVNLILIFWTRFLLMNRVDILGTIFSVEIQNFLMDSSLAINIRREGWTYTLDQIFYPLSGRFLMGQRNSILFFSHALDLYSICRLVGLRLRVRSFMLYYVGSWLLRKSMSFGQYLVDTQCDFHYLNLLPWLACLVGSFLWSTTLKYSGLWWWQEELPERVNWSRQDGYVRGYISHVNQETQEIVFWPQTEARVSTNWRWCPHSIEPNW